MSVRQLLKEMDSSEIREWQVYFKIKADESTHRSVGSSPPTMG